MLSPQTIALLDLRQRGRDAKIAQAQRRLRVIRTQIKKDAEWRDGLKFAYAFKKKIAS